MMQKILISFILVFSLNALAQESIGGKKINTLSDFQELEKVLQEAAHLEPGKSNYYLGLLYSSAFDFNNGNKKNPDYDKALPYFMKAYESGNKIASFNISMILASQGRINEAIFILDQTVREIAISGESNEASTGAYLAVALASLIMDAKSGDKEAVALGMRHLQKYVLLSDIPTGDYILSRMYLLTGDIEGANKYLTRACKNPSAPAKITSICQSFKYQK